MRPRSRSEVLNFRTDRELVERLDRLAAEERRTRASLIEKLLAEAVDLETPTGITITDDALILLVPVVGDDFVLLADESPKS